MSKEIKLSRVFLIGFILSFFAFLPFLIQDKGFLLIGADFDAQEIPLNVLANFAIKTGEVLWNWKIDLGSEFISGLGFYCLGSPFFYISLLFPPRWFPYTVAWIFMLKYAVATLTAYLYIRRYVEDKYALIGALLYAFSGFQCCNVVFYHFHDVVAFFPLLLFGLDRLLFDHKKGSFLWAVFINAFVNYYFFIGETIFCILYFLIRMYYAELQAKGKQVFVNLKTCLVEGILGVGLAGLLFVPQILTILNNPKSSNHLRIQRWFTYKPVRYLQLLRAFLLPAENMFENSTLVTDNWNSIGFYLPVVGVSLVIAYLLSTKKDWLRSLLVCSIVTLFVPVLNNIFVLETAEIQHRWSFMFLLMMALASAKVISNVNLYRWKLGIITSCIGIVLFLVIVYGAHFEIYHPNRFLIFLFVAMMGLAITYYGCSKNMTKAFIVAVLVFSCFNTSYLTYTYRRDYGEMLGMNYQERYSDIMNSTTQLSDALPYRYAFWDDYTNRSMTSNIAGRSAFLSTVSPSIINLYREFGVGRPINTSPNSPDGINELYSIKYYVRKDVWDDPFVMSYSDGYEEINVYQDNYALPIGFTYDNYMTNSEFKKIPKEKRGYAMLASLVIPDEKEAEVKQILRHYDEKQDYELLHENVEKMQLKRAKETSKDFEWDTSHFACDIDACKETYAFFSVPYDTDWKATVNGEEREIISINGLMAVKLNQGNNHIHFQFTAKRILFGLLISVLSIILTFIYHKAKKKQV
ncbi:MAG: YfhO family protein [Solobacterium sp.]|nr:YfhO family protein [Solobacterium sp.]